MSEKKKDSRKLAVPLLAAGVVLLAGVTTSVSAAKQELKNPETDGQNPSAEVQAVPNLHAALVQAGNDKEFAKELLRNPEKYRSAFNLTDDQINILKNSREAMEEANYDVNDCTYCKS